MSDLTLSGGARRMIDKPLVWLEGEVKTPPFSKGARLAAGFLLRRLQMGEVLRMPESRPMPSIGPRCHELRVQDAARAATPGESFIALTRMQS
jgi:hypothetical protein